MTISATYDKNGRVSLSTSLRGTNYAWTKSSSGQPTIALSDITSFSGKDQRPNRHWKYVPAQDSSCVYHNTGLWSNNYLYDATFWYLSHKSTGHNARQTSSAGEYVDITFTGSGIGLWITMPGGAINPSSLATASLDGGTAESFYIDNEPGSVLPSTCKWSKGGLSNTSHAVRLTFTSGSVPLIFDGYSVNDFAVRMGVPITYTCTIDGGTPESITVTPTIDYLAVVNHWTDDFVNWIGTSPAIDTYAGIEAMRGIAMAAHLTGRSDVKTAADYVKNAHLAQVNSAGVLTTYDALVWNSRVPYSFGVAYKVWGDSAYLTIFDNMVNTLLNLWPKLNGVWRPSYGSGGNPYTDFNQWSSGCYSLSMAYAEPNSAFYHSSAVLSCIVANMAWALQEYNSSTGFTPYDADSDNRDGAIYGLFVREHVRGIYANTGYYGPGDAVHGDVLTKMNEWADNTFPMVEPALSGPVAEYNQHPSPQVMAGLIPILYARNRAGLDEFREIMYSAACAGIDLRYDPVGRDDFAWNTISPYYGANVVFRGLWNLTGCWLSNVPQSLWANGLDTTAPVVTAFTLPGTASALTFNISSFTASDDIWVTGYLVTESATPPSAGAGDWSGSAPTTITASGAGSKTFYPWAKDATGNVSDVFGSPRTVVIETFGVFTLPAVTIAPIITVPSLIGVQGSSVGAFTLPQIVVSISVVAPSLLGIRYGPRYYLNGSWSGGVVKKRYNGTSWINI